jgi:hypothetical protein
LKFWRKWIIQSSNISNLLCAVKMRL